MVIAIALGGVLLHTSTLADSGFLDRTVRLGNVRYRYQVYVPADHSRRKAWPIIVDLHGNGAQGDDGLLPTARGLADQIRLNRSRFPAVVVFPQAATGKRWFEDDMEDLVVAELDRTMAEFGGDPARVYVTGFSMGGTGAYRIAYRWPTRFAALVAVAGRVDTSDAATYSDRDKELDRRANPFVSAADPFAALAARIRHLPMRIFHGDADETVPVDQSRRLAAALQAAGAKNVRYDEYAGANHVAAAEKAYGDEALFAWLFAQRR
jgi:predicted peptidase